MLKIKRARIIAGTAAAIAFPAIVRAQTPVKIRLAGVATDDLTPIYYAIQNGLYSKVGLDVEVVPVSTGTAATTAVVAGAYEMGKGNVISSLNAHLRGLPLVVVANGAIWDPKVPFSLMLIAADSPFKTASDLNGKIGATAALGDLNHLACSAWIDKNGGDWKSIKWVEIPNANQEGAVATHRADFCGPNEPQLTSAIEGGKVVVMAPAYSAIAEHFAITTYFAHPDFAAKQPDAIKRWVRVKYQSAAFTNAHHAQTAEMIAAITKLPLSVIQKIARVPAATASDPALVQPAIEVAARYNQIPHAFAAKDLYFTG